MIAGSGGSTNSRGSDFVGLRLARFASAGPTPASAGVLIE
jgi:hypothetical protein